jgi:hypothetical protein
MYVNGQQWLILINQRNGENNGNNINESGIISVNGAV